MKTRNGFVTNSSSSCFIISKKSIERAEIEGLVINKDKLNRDDAFNILRNLWLKWERLTNELLEYLKELGCTSKDYRSVYNFVYNYEYDENSTDDSIEDKLEERFGMEYEQIIESLYRFEPWDNDWAPDDFNFDIIDEDKLNDMEKALDTNDDLQAAIQCHCEYSLGMDIIKKYAQNKKPSSEIRLSDPEDNETIHIGGYKLKIGDYYKLVREILEGKVMILCGDDFRFTWFMLDELDWVCETTYKHM